ncbi:MAG: Ig-like domain-containing protein [Lachnospiraceae bacterium]|nr:Ig-like domain-containing protein [Lachnospiraceae bacterium]
MQNKNMKRLLRQSLAAVMATSLLFTCVPTQAKKASKKAVKEIQVTAPLSAKDKKVTTTLTLKKGSTFKLKTSVAPASASKKLVYKSSKKAVAAVSAKGKIKAKKVGKTTITIQPKKNKKVKAVIKVTVVKKLKKVKKITLDKTALSLSTSGNNTAQLTATIVSPKKPTTKGFNWFSSDKSVVAVNKKGLVTAKKAGTAKITVTSKDGRGAKAVCSVTVTNGSNTDNTATPSSGSQGTPTPSGSSATPGGDPGTSVTPTPAADADPAIVVPGERTGIKQGETLQLTAKDANTDTLLTEDLTWSVNEVEGVSIDDTGLLTVSKTAEEGASITVTVATSKDSDSATFTVVENKTPEITENMMQLNGDTTDDTPLGLTYRSKEAHSWVSDPERGDVVRFDASKGYNSNSYDVLAWMVVDPAYAGKTVTISAYMKYDAIPDVTVMNLVINERWKYSNPAFKYNADPDTWYHVTGTYKLPENNGNNYDGNLNRLYIARDSEHLGSTGANAINAVYYIDDLTFTVEKSEIDSVELSAADDADTIYQNHTLQFTSKVNGSNAPMQKAIYSIEPEVEGASISDDGLLTVGKVTADTITVKAAAYEDPEKYDTKTIQVLPQTIDSIKVSAEGSPETIYQNGTLQFSAEVEGTGEPDTSVTWSLKENVNNVSISKDGLLTVGKNAPADKKLTVLATSNFDTTKSASYDITILAYGITNVSLASFGNTDNTIRPGDSVNLFARVTVAGNISDDVTWSLKDAINGVTLETNEADNKVRTLKVADSVANNTSITIQVVSKEDADKKDSITITVSNTAAKVFSIDDTTVTYWQDFDDPVTYKSSAVAYSPDGTFDVYNTALNTTYFKAHASAKNKYVSKAQVCSSLLLYPAPDVNSFSNARGHGFTGYLNSIEDYYSFVIQNDEQTEKTYTLSFFADFLDVVNEDATDVSKVLASDITAFKYKLPLKVVDEEGETLTSASLTMRCCQPTRAAQYADMQEFIISVKVPASSSKTLKLMAESLPFCFSESHKSSTPEAENAPHPVQVCIDNISITSRTTDEVPVINLKVGDSYPLNLSTTQEGTVAYTTNDFLSYMTHSHFGIADRVSDAPHDVCQTTGKTFPRIADVDYETGMITALGAGQTMVTAAITNDGSTTYKQCILNVTE